MSTPRNLYPDTVQFVTCCCTHGSYRLVPTKTVRRIVRYAFAVVSSRYRKKYGMEFYEFLFLSTHFHIVLYDRFGGRTSDFLKDLNSLIARALNAVRGDSGSFFAREPGIQTVLGDAKVIKHCVYTLANAVKAGIVHKAAHWKGFNSLRLEYGKEYVVEKPRIGLWATKKAGHRRRRASRRSGRAAFAGRSKLPAKATLMLDRPRICPELSDAQLRAKIREALTREEARIHAKRKGKPVLGMKAALKIHWSTTPVGGKPLFSRRPTFSTQTKAQRKKMRRLRREFLGDYPQALRRWNAGERDVVFPAGTVRMKLRHNALTEPIPFDLLLAG